MINLDSYMMTPGDILHAIAANEKVRRKQERMTQEELAERSGVSLPSLRRFEQKGEIALSSLVRIASVLDAQGELLKLFPQKEYSSMKELLDAKNGKN